jgi:adenylate cyclase class 2
MALEIEAKMKVSDHSAIREKLKATGAKPAGAVLEVNTFFDTEDRSLLAADEGLRLRQQRDIAGGVNTYIITFKGPRTHGQLKSREEVEVTVGSDKDAVALLGCLGFSRVMSFQKKRESWKLGGCSIELDEVPYLGTYIEIEGPSEDAVLKVRELLQLSDIPIVRASYIALLTTYLQEKGIVQKEIKFP